MNDDSEFDPTATEMESSAWHSEDVWAIWLGAIVLGAALAATWWAHPADYPERLSRYEQSNQRLDEFQRAPAPMIASS